jgi:putative heme iron utilization protein
MSVNRHAGGSRAQELLYDADIPTPSDAEHARTLAQIVSEGALSTFTGGEERYPYGSFSTYAMTGSAPVFLISELAEHTQNLRRDTRCSLLVVAPGEGDPLARARATLVGNCDLVATPSDVRQEFLDTHPSAAYYADFKDFHFWRMRVKSVRYIGGYGRMSWVTEPEWNSASPDPTAPLATGVLTHMNQDHGEAMVLMCRAFSRASDTTSAVMTNLDRYGFEMSATTAQGPRPIRLAFSKAVDSSEEVRAEMVALTRKARS